MPETRNLRRFPVSGINGKNGATEFFSDQLWDCRAHNHRNGTLVRGLNTQHEWVCLQSLFFVKINVATE